MGFVVLYGFIPSIETISTLVAVPVSTFKFLFSFDDTNNITVVTASQNFKPCKLNIIKSSSVIFIHFFEMTFKLQYQKPSNLQNLFLYQHALHENELWVWQDHDKNLSSHKKGSACELNYPGICGPYIWQDYSCFLCLLFLHLDESSCTRKKNRLVRSILQTSNRPEILFLKVDSQIINISVIHIHKLESCWWMRLKAVPLNFSKETWSSCIAYNLYE